MTVAVQPVAACKIKRQQQGHALISADEMPDDNAKLASIGIEFPQLELNTAASCPVSLADVVEYLRAESSDTDSVQASLQFLRTAQVAGPPLLDLVVSGIGR